MSDAENLNARDLMRCTKDELINFIFELRDNINFFQKEDGKLWDIVSRLKQVDKIRDIWENCD